MSFSSKLSTFSSFVSEIVRKNSKIASFFLFFASSSRVVESTFSSSEFLFFSMLESEIVRERSENVSFKSTFAQQSVEHVISFFIFAIKFVFASISFSTFDLLFFSFVLCDHVSENHFMTRDFKTLYSMHLIENAKILRCS